MKDRRPDLSPSPSKRHKDNSSRNNIIDDATTLDLASARTIDPSDDEACQELPDQQENEGRGRSRVKTRVVSLGQPEKITLMGYNTGTTKPISRPDSSKD